MKLTVIVQLQDYGVIATSIASSRVRHDYAEAQLGERVKKQFRAAKAQLAVRIAAKLAEDGRQFVLFN